MREEDKPLKNPSGEVNVNKILQTSEGQDRAGTENDGLWEVEIFITH